jgi:glutamate carboxypeptidase
VIDSLELLETHEAQMLGDLRLFVEQEAPYTDKTLLDTFAGFLTTYADERTGRRAKILSAEGSGDQVRRGDEGGEAPILLLVHYDTVWPTGTPPGDAVRRPRRPRNRASSTRSAR